VKTLIFKYYKNIKFLSLYLLYCIDLNIYISIIILRIRIIIKKYELDFTMKYISKIFITLIFLFTVFGCNSLFESFKADANEINLYSARKEHLIKPLTDSFTESTGIKVNIITAKAAQLHQRIVREGDSSKADVLLTVDAGNLWKASNDNLLQEINSNFLNSRIKSKYKDPNNKWFGLSLRARIIVYSTDRVKKNELIGYKYLANPIFKNRILIRSSSNIYNQSLIAHMISKYGINEAEKWAAGMVNNFARNPAGGDRDQIKAVAAGEGDIAVVNSYYIAKMLNSDNKDLFNSLSIYFPSDDDMGTHLNISGAALLKNAPNAENAIKFIEFLVSDKAQSIYSNSNFEYPVVENIEISDILQSFGIYTEDNILTSEYGKLGAEAIKIADRVGWK
tara:strand:+ start:4122 stop:5300 length:1179 start_codon:yes stop_codon:yes gene_type:complete